MSREGYALLRKTGSSRQVRLALFAQEQAALLYSASETTVSEGKAVESHPPYIARLGLDLLDPAIDAAVVRTHLDATRFARTNIAALSLKQRFFAGVGNYLPSEILFAARISLRHVLGALADNQRNAVAKATLDTTWQSYQTGGITVDYELVNALRARGWSHRRYWH